MGTNSTGNVNSPQLVVGPWETTNNSIKLGAKRVSWKDAKMKDVETRATAALSVIQDTRVVVRNIFCGGDQSFSLVSPYTVRAAMFFIFLRKIFLF